MNVGQITVTLAIEKTKETDLLFRAAKALNMGVTRHAQLEMADEIYAALATAEVGLPTKSDGGNTVDVANRLITEHADGIDRKDPEAWVREATVTLARFVDAAAPRSDARAQAMDRAGETGEVVMQRDMGAAVARERLRNEFEEWYLRDCHASGWTAISLQDITDMREDDTYGEKRAALNGKWKGFKAARGCA